MFTAESRVGLFVVIALVALGWLTMQSGVIGSQGFSSNNRFLESEFTDAEGIVLGSKVKMAGIEIGEVSDINLTREGSAVIRMSIRQDVPLPENIQAEIASSGLIGEQFMALVTEFGAAEADLPTTVVRIPNRGSSSPDNIANNFGRISEDLQEITSALRQAFGGQENADKLKNIVNSLESVGGRLEDILVSEVKPGQVETIMNGLTTFSTKLDENGADILDNIHQASSSLKTILGDNEEEASQMIKNFNIASANLARITSSLEGGNSTLGKLMTEEDTLITDLKAAAADLKAVASKINNGEGTLGRLINDPSTVDKVENALEQFAAVGERMEAFRTDVALYGYGLSAENVSKGRFDVTLSPRPTRYYRIGILSDGFATQSDDPRDNLSLSNQEFGSDVKFTAQFGQRFQNIAFGQDIGVRFGLKDSTFGAGVDTVLQHHWLPRDVEVSADIYDFAGTNQGNSNDTPHLDITTKVNVFKNHDFLYAVGGYDNVFNQEIGSPFMGLGVRFVDDDLKYLVGSTL